MEIPVGTSPRLYARMAGVSYLLGALTSVLGQMVVLDMLVVSGGATATAANVLSHELLFRLGFVSSLMTVPLHIVWAVLFYGLFKPVNRIVPRLAVFVMLVACTMWALSSLLYLAPLLILQGKTSLSAFAPEQLQALAFVFLRLPCLKRRASSMRRVILYLTDIPMTVSSRISLKSQKCG